MEVEEFLEHHGVKGQKWGIRKKIAKSGARVGRGFDIHNKNPDDEFSTAKKAALITAGGIAAFVILQRVGLRILL